MDPHEPFPPDLHASDDGSVRRQLEELVRRARSERAPGRARPTASLGLALGSFAGCWALPFLLRRARSRGNGPTPER